MHADVQTLCVRVFREQLQRISENVIGEVETMASDLVDDFSDSLETTERRYVCNEIKNHARDLESHLSEMFMDEQNDFAETLAHELQCEEYSSAGKGSPKPDL